MSNLTDVTVLVDRSGSMCSIKDAMEEALNGLVEDQKKDEDKVNLTVYQFDECGWGDEASSQILDTVLDTTSIHEITQKLEIEPRGSTPLLDAMGMSITRTGERLAAMPENERPNRVLFVVITDGGENSSSEYKRPQVIEMVKHQEEQYNWTFVYLGTNQDGIAEGMNLGVGAGFSGSYSGTHTSIASGMRCTVNRLVKSTKKSSDAEYCERATTFCLSDEERDNLMK